MIGTTIKTRLNKQSPCFKGLINGATALALFILRKKEKGHKKSLVSF